MIKEKIINLSTKLTVLLLVSFLLAGSAVTASAADSLFTNPDKIKYLPLAFNLPQVQRTVLENGIVIYILEDHELPIVNINAIIKTGTIHDPEDKEGVAELTAYVMRTGGTAQLNSEKIDSRFDFLAASAAINMSMESADVDFSVLNTNLDQGLDLLAQILTAPAFEQKKLELAKELKKEDLRRLKDEPQRLAFREFNRLIYRGDPRGRFPSHKSLANIDREDLIRFHRRFFQPNNIMFAVTGDITRQQAIDKLRHYFGNWKAESTATQTALPPQNSNAGLYYLNKEIPQSTIISGQFAVSKTDPDFYAFTVLDFIAGSGGFPSRIFNAVRNNEGLAYSAGSFYRARPAYGVFGTYAFTKTSSTLKTLSLINSVLDNIKSNTLTGKELAWAKTSINNSFIFSFTSAEKIAGKQMNIEYEKLPADFLINYRNKIESVTLKDVNRVAAKYLDKTKNIVLILGDTKQFDEPSTKTGQPILITPED
jgi:predicted Zn-dependent peptidase